MSAMLSINSLLTLGIRTFVLFGFWWLLSGKTDSFYLSVGFLCSLAISILMHSPQRDNSAVKSKLKVLYSLPGYAIWLLGRIILAAVHVSKIVLHPKMPIDPRFIEHKTTLKTDREKVLFANSITLTPGTITADIKGDIFTIHEFDAASSGDIVSGTMEAKIAKVY